MTKDYEELRNEIADVVWWLRGYLAGKPEDEPCGLGSHHIEALVAAMEHFRKEAKNVDKRGN